MTTTDMVERIEPEIVALGLDVSMRSESESWAEEVENEMAKEDDSEELALEIHAENEDLYEGMTDSESND